jgi:hypothetical protein
MTVDEKPLCIDLFCGMFGWGRAFAQNGWRVVGFDIAHEPYHGEVPDGCELVLQDVLTLHGSQFRDAACIVASPPCQKYSWLAMPWSRSKSEHSQAAKALRWKWETEGPDNRLFDACFRIQREGSEAAGRRIPLIVENVRGAQEWVGRAAWSFGSFYLWGNVPALMPFPRGERKRTGRNFHTYALTGGAVTSPSFHGAEHETRGVGLGVKVESLDGGRRTDIGKGARFTSRDCGVEALKIGGDWFSDSQSTLRRHGSRSNARKAASAAIAKIPPALAEHIARVYYP